MKRVFVISPFAGAAGGKKADADRIAANVEAARWLCRRLTLMGYAVFAPHLFYTAFLDGKSPPERANGIAAGHAWLEVADMAVVYRFGGVLSDGMVLDIARAKARGLEIMELVEPVDGVTPIDIDPLFLRPYVD